MRAACATSWSCSSEDAGACPRVDATCARASPNEALWSAAASSAVLRSSMRNFASASYFAFASEAPVRACSRSFVCLSSFSSASAIARPARTSASRAGLPPCGCDASTSMRTDRLEAAMAARMRDRLPASESSDSAGPSAPGAAFGIATGASGTDAALLSAITAPFKAVPHCSYKVQLCRNTILLHVPAVVY